MNYIHLKYFIYFPKLSHSEARPFSWCIVKWISYKQMHKAEMKSQSKVHAPGIGRRELYRIQRDGRKCELAGNEYVSATHR